MRIVFRRLVGAVFVIADLWAIVAVWGFWDVILNQPEHWPLRFALAPILAIVSLLSLPTAYMAGWWLAAFVMERKDTRNDPAGRHSG